MARDKALDAYRDQLETARNIVSLARSLRGNPQLVEQLMELSRCVTEAAGKFYVAYDNLMQDRDRYAALIEENLVCCDKGKSRFENTPFRKRHERA